MTPTGCVCTNVNLYFINGTCSSCPPNSYYNGQTCVCASGVYSATQNVCTYCNPPAVLLGSQCSCPTQNQVYILDSCYPCDQSCATCSGSTQTQCLTCANGLPPVNGVCYSQSSVNCPASTFYSSATNSCQNCIGFCTSCQDSSSCQQCISGFNLTNGQCVEICGDARKFQLPCDDGNRLRGDGCNSNCQVEPGWNCSGGSPFSKDNCTPAATSPLKPFSLAVKDMYHVKGIIVVTIVVSYIPQELLQNNCSVCTSLLTSTVFESQQQPLV